MRGSIRTTSPISRRSRGKLAHPPDVEVKIGPEEDLADPPRAFQSQLAE
jgi:hypothetical protein